MVLLLIGALVAPGVASGRQVPHAGQAETYSVRTHATVIGGRETACRLTFDLGYANEDYGPEGRYDASGSLSVTGAAAPVIFELGLSDGRSAVVRIFAPGAVALVHAGGANGAELLSRREDSVTGATFIFSRGPQTQAALQAIAEGRLILSISAGPGFSGQIVTVEVPGEAARSFTACLAALDD